MAQLIVCPKDGSVEIVPFNCELSVKDGGVCKAVDGFPGIFENEDGQTSVGEDWTLNRGTGIGRSATGHRAYI